MNTHHRVASSFLLCLLCFMNMGCVEKTAYKELSWKTYEDKVYGGWLGQMIGVQFGESTEGLFDGWIIPFEMNEYLRIIPEHKPAIDSLVNSRSPDKRGKIYEIVKDRSNWEVFTPEGAPDQDDIYVELTFLAAFRKFGLDVTGRQTAELWLEHLPPSRLWGANKVAYQNFRKGIWPPDSGSRKHSPFWNWIDFQIESDLFGLISPGLPQTAVRLGGPFGHMMNDGDGVYAGQFISCIYSYAFFESEPEAVIRRALHCIPENSRYAQMVRDVLQWHQKYPDWTTTWGEIEKKWSVQQNRKRVSVLDATINGSYILMGLLYGDGDFHKTMEISSRCGRDSDCNPSNAAGILGCIQGAGRIPQKWKAPMKDFYNNSTLPALYPPKVTHKSLVDYTTELGKKVVVSSGGIIKDETLYIPKERP